MHFQKPCLSQPGCCRPGIMPQYVTQLAVSTHTRTCCQSDQAECRQAQRGRLCRGPPATRREGCYTADVLYSAEWSKLQKISSSLFLLSCWDCVSGWFHRPLASYKYVTQVCFLFYFPPWFKFTPAVYPTLLLLTVFGPATAHQQVYYRCLINLEVYRCYTALFETS